MAHANRIFLVGPMGAGKTTVGRSLAGVMGFSFLDSDTEIESRTGADIPWIFEIEGESGFRDRETQAIEELSKREGVVLATGGGAVMRDANRSVLAERGFVVYLRASVREQVRRTGNDRNRPLLNSGNRAEVLQKLMAIRDPLYGEIADLVLATEGKNARKLAHEIAAAVRGNAPA